jgi:hypothetical protein
MVAAEAATAVREVIARAEREAKALRDQAERDAQERLRRVADEARALRDEAQRKAHRHAEERAQRVLERRGEIAVRADRLLGSLAGAQEDRATLDRLLRELDGTAEHVLATATDPDEPQPAAGGAAGGAEGTGAEAPAAETGGPRTGETTRDQGEGAATPEIPVGAPLVRKPRRSRRKSSGEVGDVKFTAIRMAVAGLERGEVEAQLRHAFGDDRGYEEILDEVFGTVRAR